MNVNPLGNKKIILVLALVLIAGAIWYLESGKVNAPRPTGESVDLGLPTAPPGSTSSPAATSSQTGRQSPALPAAEGSLPSAKELVQPAGFVNTPPFKLADLVGKKVILLDFWTYSCINCERTLPYLNAWYGKYKDQGLEIVGVHTPEFDFEKVLANVQAAVRKYGVQYPVVLDNDYGTWYAYDNHYWPHEYLIDVYGRIAHDHIGEGGYEETETEIQKLLAQRMQVLGEKGEISQGMVQPSDATAVNFLKVLSPETYFGSNRNEYLGNGVPGQAGEQQLSAPTDIKSNTLYLAGDWDFEPEYAQNRAASAKIIFKYNSKNVYLVAAGPNVRAQLLLDGAPLGTAAGEDVTTENGQSFITLSGNRLYKLVSDPSGYGEHTLEIILENTGAQFFTFTFG